MIIFLPVSLNICFGWPGAQKNPLIETVLLYMDLFCYLCLMFVMLSRLFIAALWSPTGKGLTSWLLFVMFNCVLSLSHVVSWVRCGA